MTQPDSPTDSPASPPITLKERVFALACQGMRSPTIAQELGIPERTARAWIQQIRSEAADDRKASRRTDLALAIERQLAISTAAWQGYERAARAERQVVAQFERPTSLEEPIPVARFTAAGARYLTVAQSAQREAARLQDLYGMPDEPEEPQQLPFLVINAPPAHPDDLPPEDRQVWDAFMAWRRAHRPDDPTPFTYSPFPTTDPAPSASPFLPQREGDPRGEAAGQDAAPSASPFLPQREGGQGVRLPSASPSPETEKPAETASAPAAPLDIRDLPGVATYPPNLTNPAPVTPELRRHLTAKSEVLYMPAPPRQPPARRNARPVVPSRPPRLGIPPPRR